jgi:signal transduction histidine kinase
VSHREEQDRGTCEGRRLLERQLQRRNEVLETSLTIGRAVSAELEMERLCDLIVDQVYLVFSPERVALLFWDEQRGEMYIKRHRGAVEAEAQGQRLAASDGAAFAALKEQRSVVLPSGHPQLRDSAYVEPFAAPSSMVAVPLAEPERNGQDHVPGGTAAVPLMAERQVKGVLALTWSRGDEQPSQDDLQLLEVVAAQASAAIDNAWLYGELTRLNEGLEEEIRARTAELDGSNRELEATLSALKQAQGQLVQTAKMASLGQLTAGVAHEINNPLAFVINNVTMARRRLDELVLWFFLGELRDELNRGVADEDLDDAMMNLCRQLEQLPRFRDDSRAFRDDWARRGPGTAVALGTQFTDYLELRLAQDGHRQERCQALGSLLERASLGLERVKKTVLDLRSFARLDEADFKEVDLDGAIGQTLAIAQHLANEREVTLTHQAGLQGAYPCWPAKLNQVVLNLVTNAVQATPAGGAVQVITRETDAGPVVEVLDDGPGIPPEIQGQIFDPFFTTKPVGQGTGLGLSISYQIVEQHGGSIQVKSPLREGPRAGARLRLRLPPRAAGG